MFTERCNARCRHCSVPRFMHEEQDMPVADAFRYIEQFAALPRKENSFTIALTGGEAFLRYPDLLAVTRYAKKKGAAHVTCVTNGFWGKDRAMARYWATELHNSGMDRLCFSLGDFHQEYILLDSVLSAFAVCREVGLRLAIKCVVTRHTHRLPQVLGNLGNLLLDAEVIIQEIACVPEGRAAKEIPQSELLLQEGIPQEPCPGLVSLTILPDGTTFPCCGGGWTERLVVGNARTEPMADLMNRARNKPLFAALQDKGPLFFVPYFAQAGFPLPQEGYVNSCHLCMAIMDHPKLERILPSALRDWKIERVQKSLGGLWKPDKAEHRQLRILTGEKHKHAQSRKVPGRDTA